jgi:pimeloyl-ACP methyl ester carboxylesterase
MMFISHSQQRRIAMPKNTNTDFLYSRFSVLKDGFAGQMAEPKEQAEKAVIVLTGGEKSVLPGIKIAERFADYGIVALSVSLFGAENLPTGPDRIPADMVETAVRYLREKRKFKSVSIYGMSMGSVIAALAAIYTDGIDNLILVSPSHVSFEGTLDKKHMTSHSFALWKCVEIPFVKADFSKYKAMFYRYDPRAKRKVLGMWSAFMDGYEDQERERQAVLPLEKTGARILMMAGSGDEAWPSDYSVQYLKNYLDKAGYEKEYKALLYPDASHLLGAAPSRQREKRLYRMLPLIALIYRQFHTNKKECLQALEQSEKEAVDWILQEEEDC